MLAKNEDESVRQDVASNPNTPAAVLELLAKDEARRVRGDVAGNPSTPVALPEELPLCEVGVGRRWGAAESEVLAW